MTIVTQCESEGADRSTTIVTAVVGRVDIRVICFSCCATNIAICVTSVVIGVVNRRHSFMLTNIANNVTVR